MSELFHDRYTAHVEGEFAVLLIGMRINRPWLVHRWWPVFSAMSAMLNELAEHPEKGLLGAHRCLIGGPAVVQYWRSYEHLERFARARDDLHMPAWAHWNRVIRDTRAVGIWHETYVMRGGDHEAIYVSMPRFGLAAATAHVPVAHRGESSRERIRAASVSSSG
jgi:hypothetical protein